MPMTLELGRPTDCTGRLEKEIRCYDLLDSLRIRYSRIDHEAAMTMEDCAALSQALEAPVCKNLLLCNRQRTQFYLLMLPGEKQFQTSVLSGQIGSSRLSFAGPEDMERLLDITPGSLSVLGLMNDPEHHVSLLIDQDILKQPAFGCHPCINTSTLSMTTEALTDTLLPALGRSYRMVVLPSAL